MAKRGRPKKTSGLTEAQIKKQKYNAEYWARKKAGTVEAGKRGRKAIANPTELQLKRREYQQYRNTLLKALGKPKFGKHLAVIEGTNIKVSRAVYTKFKKGIYGIDTLKKNILKNNQLMGPLRPGEKLDNTSLKQILKTNPNINSKDLQLKEIRTQWRSATAKINKDLVVNSVIQELSMKSLNAQEQAELAKLMATGQWHWNDTTKRFENGEGGWITINEHKGDYSHKNLDWGN